MTHVVYGVSLVRLKKYRLFSVPIVEQYIDIYHHRFIVRFPKGLDFPLITLPVLLMEYWSRFLRPDAFSGVNHMRGMQYKIVLSITFWWELN